MRHRNQRMIQQQNDDDDDEKMPFFVALLLPCVVTKIASRDLFDGGGKVS